jgi:hypothetical protein
MTRDQALEVARAIWADLVGLSPEQRPPRIAQALLDAVQSEREACAKILDDWDTSESWENPDDYTDEIAKAIRQREEQSK